MISADQITGRPRIDLDWRAYFYLFMQEHGGDPILIGTKLLFRDGWTYSATDYRGPEYPPPEELRQRQTLIRTYWRRRLAALEADQIDLNERLLAFQNLQTRKSAPLQQKLLYRSEDGSLVQDSSPVDYESITEHLDWLRQEIAQCLEKIRENEDGTKQLVTRSDSVHEAIGADGQYE